MIRKVGMVKYARLQVRNKLDASMLATKLRKEDVEEAINKKKLQQLYILKRLFVVTNY